MFTAYTFLSLFFFYLYGYHRDLHLLTPSFPTRRSSDLPQSPSLDRDQQHDQLVVPQRLRHQQFQVCRHADGNEEQAEQQTFERLDIGMEFMAKLGFGQQARKSVV